MKNYNKKELEAYLKNKLLLILEMVKLVAVQFASQGLPRLQDTMHTYFAEFHHQCQGLIDEIAKAVGFQTISQEVNQRGITNDSHLQRTKNKLLEAQTFQTFLANKLKNMPRPIDPKRAMYVLIAISFTSLADGIYNFPVYISWGLDIIGAIIASIILATLLTLLAHIFTRLVDLGKTIWQKRLIVFVITAMLISLFSYMGYARSNYMEALGKANGVVMNVSPVPFILGSLLFIVVAVCIYAFYMPKPHEIEYAKEYADVIKEKKEADQEVIRLEKEITDTQNNHTSLVVAGTQEYEDGKFLEQMVVNDTLSMFRLFCRYNLMNRNDGVNPIAFSLEYPFTFKLYFNNSNNTKSLQNETE